MSTLLYEQALYSESFRNDILKGRYTDQELKTLVESNTLNSYQLQVLQELAPNIAPQQSTQAQTPQAPTQQSQNPAANQQYKPAQGQTSSKQVWGNIMKNIQQSRLIPLLQTLPPTNPNDKYLNDVVQYIIKSLTDLNAHIK